MTKKIGITAIVVSAMFLLTTGPASAVSIVVDLVAEKIKVTMPNTGEVVPMWGYRLAADPAGSATVPGPTIRATSADDLTINLTSNLDQPPAVGDPVGLVEPTSIVIPGQTATEASAMVPTWTDGTTGPRSGDPTKRVRSFTHEVAPGGSGTYQWATLSPGTFLIQSGTHPAVQVQMGLYAVLVVDDAGQAGAQVHGQAFDADQVLLFSEIDPALHAAVANDNYGPGKPVTSTMHYAPKYFLLNGIPYSDAGDLAITGTPGNDILLRFLNAGLQTRIPQLLGAYLTPLAEDGHPLPFAKQQHSLILPAGKTIDALLASAPAASIPMLDRRLAFSTDVPTITEPVLIAGLGIFRDGSWYFDTNGNGQWDEGIDAVASFGEAGDVPVFGDWNGDGTTEIGTYRNGFWYLDVNGNFAWDEGVDTAGSFGEAGDVPVFGDWNGDGTTDIGTYRNGFWYLDVNGNFAWDEGVDTAGSFGEAGDVPVSGDWNGDGTTEIGTYRNGFWYLDVNGNFAWDEGVDTTGSFGDAGDVPVFGDWNGDGTTDIGTYRNGFWYLDVNGNFAWDEGVDSTGSFGQAGDVPVTGSWN